LSSEWVRNPPSRGLEVASRHNGSCDGNERALNAGMDQAYQGKLDGKICEEFWMRKSGEWQAEENQIRAAMQGLETVSPERLLDAAKILELASKAYFLYVKQNHTERAKLLKMVLSNCGIDAISLYPIYRKPFDLIFEKVKTEEWYAQGDDFRTFLGDFVSSLSETDLIVGLNA
jgi:hypothetical protein